MNIVLKIFYRSVRIVIPLGILNQEREVPRIWILIKERGERERQDS